MAEVVKATEIAPGAFGLASPAAPITSSDLPSDRVDDLDYDLHHLVASDTHPVDLEKFQADPEAYLNERALFGAQCLINRLFNLPCETSDVGPIAELPRATTTLPREKPIPQPKKETRWEKFAKEKGITKKKKSRMMWDEASQEWKPRWGYGRANAGEEEEPIIEVKEGDDPYADPWSQARAEKKARVQKNLKQKQKNTGETPGDQLGNAFFGLPLDMRPGRKEGGAGDMKVGKKGKAGTIKTLEAVQKSTASMGKFDDKVAGEPERKTGPKRKVVGAVADKKGLETEAESMRKILNSVMHKVDPVAKPRHVNIDALEPERAGYKRKKGRGGAPKKGKKAKA